MDRGAPWQRCLTRPEMLIRDAGGRSLRRFFTTASDTLRYSQFRLIRSDRRYPLSREHGQSVATAFPIAQRPSQTPAKVELAPMLPGFRFLFVAIMLTLSILICGLGAAALLRVAHEDFASNPSWHAAHETT